MSAATSLPGQPLRPPNLGAMSNVCTLGAALLRRLTLLPLNLRIEARNV